MIALAGGVACDHNAKPGAGSAPPASAIPERGDRIVIEQTAAEFFEARVLSGKGRSLRVQTTEGGEFRHIQASDAYRLPPAPHDWQAGDLGICSPRPARWEPCRVTRVGGAWLDTVDAKGHALHVARSNVLVPTPLTRLNLQRYFELAHRREAFSRAAVAAGRPEPPEDWRPSPRERVLALHDARWYPATIREIDDDVLRVRWRADDRISELPYDSVVPTPPYDREVHRGDFVLVRPTSMAAAWLPVQVDSVGADSIRVTNIDGEHRSVRPADVVPLQHEEPRGSHTRKPAQG